MADEQDSGRDASDATEARRAKKAAAQLAWYHRTKHRKGIASRVTKTREEKLAAKRERDRRDRRKKAAAAGRKIKDRRAPNTVTEAERKAQRAALGSAYWRKHGARLRAARRAKRGQENADQRARRSARLNEARAYARSYYLENIERRRELAREYLARHRDDPSFIMTRVLRGRLRAALLSIKAGKTADTLSLLGCTVGELIAHIEGQFLPGMAWSNHGLRGWHVDHIEPCHMFDLTDPEQQRACFHFTNLRPLWAVDNLARPRKRRIAALS